MPAVRGARLSPMLLPALDAALVHEPGTAFFTGINPGLLEIAQDPRRPVVAPALRVEPDDLVDQFSILLRSGARLRRQPPVVPGPAHAKHLAKEPNVMFALHRLDPGIPLSGVSERMPTDFFSTISRSRIRTNSARNRRISASFSSIVCGAGPAPLTAGPYSLRHRYSTHVETPNSAATCLIVRSPRRLISTALRLYVSSWACARFIPVVVGSFMRSSTPLTTASPAQIGRFLRQALRLLSSEATYLLPVNAYVCVH